jgi:hypothetical protein
LGKTVKIEASLWVEKMSVRSLLRLIFLTMLLSGTGLTYAESCSFRTKIKFSDGQEGCLADLPLAAKTPTSWGQSIDKVAQRASFYLVVAASSCSNAEIFSTNNYQPAQVFMIKDLIAKKAADYIAACPKECDCTLVVNDGNVLLPRSLAMAFGGGDDAKIASVKSQAQAKAEALERMNAEKARIEEAQRKERLTQQAQALQREQQLLAEAEALRVQRKFEDKAKVKEELRLA